MIRQVGVPPKDKATQHRTRFHKALRPLSCGVLGYMAVHPVPLNSHLKKTGESHKDHVGSKLGGETAQMRFLEVRQAAMRRMGISVLDDLSHDPTDKNVGAIKGFKYRWRRGVSYTMMRIGAGQEGPT